MLGAGHFAVDAQPGVIADLALGFLQAGRLAPMADKHADTPNQG